MVAQHQITGAAVSCDNFKNRTLFVCKEEEVHPAPPSSLLRCVPLVSPVLVPSPGPQSSSQHSRPHTVPYSPHQRLCTCSGRIPMASLAADGPPPAKVPRLDPGPSSSSSPEADPPPGPSAAAAAGAGPSGTAAAAADAGASGSGPPPSDPADAPELPEDIIETVAQMLAGDWQSDIFFDLASPMHPARLWHLRAIQPFCVPVRGSRCLLAPPPP